MRDAGTSHWRKIEIAVFEKVKKAGRAQSRRDSEQHQQAKVESAIGRFKEVLGRSLRARCPGGQQVEVMMGVEVLNRMLELGSPRSVSVPTRASKAAGKIRTHLDSCTNADRAPVSLRPTT